jgi:threonylcarbamoyladenosine tRNA methylthiotransferase MtaB
MKVHLRMLGCRLNQAEIDRMARQFQRQGHEIVANPAEADQVVVNTCAVTQEATKSSRKLVRELHHVNANAAIAVTGCYAHIAPDEISVLLGVNRVIDNLAKEKLVESITGVPVEPFDAEPIVRDETLPCAAGRTRAFIKAQDGCDNSCTFCITTVARGAGRSRPIADIVTEIQRLQAMDYQEIVLTGVHLGSYGYDFGDPDGLIHLVRAILAETDIPRIRLSSLEPWDLSPEFFDLWSDSRVCRHLHLPLQSGCDATLKRMRRNINQANFRHLIQTARQQIPDVSITTDVIVGFPGETDEEFASSKTFIEEMDFAGMHIFRYSKRDGTPAARMRNHIPDKIKKERSAQLHQLANEGEKRFAARFLGASADILWEHVNGATQDGFINVGYTDHYIRARTIFPRPLTNHITSARILDYDMHKGQLLVEPAIE